jgi:hypothetical protein
MKKILIIGVLLVIGYKYLTYKAEELYSDGKNKVENIADVKQNDTLKVKKVKKPLTKKEIFERVLVAQSKDLDELKEYYNTAESQTGKIWYQCKIDILKNEMKATEDVISEE